MKRNKKLPHIVAGTDNEFHIGEMLRGIWKCLLQIASLLEKLIGRIDALFDLHKPPMSKYADVVFLVYAIMSDRKLGIKSIPKAIQFIRSEESEHSAHYAKCVEARNYVMRRAKNCEDGEEKAWRSIAKMAQPNRMKKRRRARNAPPGPVPIPDLSWA